MSAHRLRFLALFIAIAVFALPAVPTVSHAADDKRKLPFVAVTAIIRDAAIDALYTGMTDALRKAGFRNGESVRLRFESAQADTVRATELIRSFGRDRADIIVAFTEPSARIAARWSTSTSGRPGAALASRRYP